jgi:type IV secretory pathway TrbF-like protein
MTSQTRTETLCAENRPSPAITRAAERYLEQYGDPLVMNTYLKIAILVLATTCLMLGFLIFRSQKALANIHPLVIRIDDVGHAEAVDFRDFNYRPKEAENKYYLSRWAELFFSRNRYTIQHDFTNSLYFMNADVQRAVVEDYRKNKTIDAFIHDSTMPYVDIEVKNVILDDLRQSPYSARVEFLKIYTNPADHSELKRERWTASVTYVFRSAVQNGEIQVNPLGLTIVNFRADQAFE